VSPEPTPATAVRRAGFKACLAPGLLGNVLLAGERRAMTQLHRPRARTLERGGPTFSPLQGGSLRRRAFGAEDDGSHSREEPALTLRRFLTPLDNATNREVSLAVHGEVREPTGAR